MNKNKFLLFLIFFIWPFIAFLISILQYQKKESKIVVYLFLAFFGFTFVIGNENLDSFRYAEYFDEIAKYSYSNFKQILAGFLVSEGTLDLAQPTLSFFISRLGDDHRLFFGFIALIFGLFYLKSINHLYDEEYKLNRNVVSLFFLLYFTIIINPIFNINGFRFYTATWIFFYGVYSFLNKKEKHYLFIALSSSLFHISFLAPSAVFIVYMFIGNRNFLYISLVVISFFLSELVFQLLPQLSNLLGEGVASRTGRYANLNTIENVAEQAELARQQGMWYMYLPARLTFYYLSFSFLYFTFKYKNIITEKGLQNTVSFSILFLAFANSVSFIPSMGRFYSIFYLFGIASIIGILKHLNYRNIKWIVYLGILPFLLNLIVVLRLAIDITNPWLFALLPFPFLYPEQSIYQLLFL